MFAKIQMLRDIYLLIEYVTRLFQYTSFSVALLSFPNVNQSLLGHLHKVPF